MIKHTIYLEDVLRYTLEYEQNLRDEGEMVALLNTSQWCLKEHLRSPDLS